METVEDLVRLAIEFVDAFSPNSKVIDGPNTSNYTLWAHSLMPRHVGLFGSCPSTNAKIFGFDPSDLKDGTVQ